MQIYFQQGDQPSGPFGLAAFHAMVRLGSVPPDAQVWCDARPDWMSLQDFLLLHPLPQEPAESAPTAAAEPRAKRAKGFAGAMVAGLGAGLVLGTLSALLGAVFTILWIPLAWVVGYFAQEWAGKPDQVVGIFAIFGSLVGMYLSVIGLFAFHGDPQSGFGSCLTPISFIAAIWLSFRAASTK